MYNKERKKEKEKERRVGAIIIGQVLYAPKLRFTKMVPIYWGSFLGKWGEKFVFFWKDVEIKSLVTLP